MCLKVLAEKELTTSAEKHSLHNSELLGAGQQMIHLKDGGYKLCYNTFANGEALDIGTNGSDNTNSLMS